MLNMQNIQPHLQSTNWKEISKNTKNGNTVLRNEWVEFGIAFPEAIWEYIRKDIFYSISRDISYWGNEMLKKKKNYAGRGNECTGDF